jgi:hypothetical protein
MIGKIIITKNATIAIVVDNCRGLIKITTKTLLLISSNSPHETPNKNLKSLLPIPIASPAIIFKIMMSALVVYEIMS